MLSAREITERYGVPERTVYVWFGKLGIAKGKRGSASTSTRVERSALEPFIQEWKEGAAGRAARFRNMAERLELLAKKDREL